ncbi:MAG: hypothetical protein CMJ23_08790 [Phycisphaerae bacterium]|nr:hypothetical protein [Phycisphaerae bacterium]
MSRKISHRGPVRGRFVSRIAIAASGMLAFAGTAAAQDDCSFPASISAGIHPLNLDQATTSWVGSLCLKGQVIHHDSWYCFEATVDGVVKISTCGLTQVDTRMQLWAGCECPDPDQASPLCCNDNACGKQAEIVCDVVCGQRYMLQIGSASEGEIGPGDFTIEFQGDDCDGPGGGGTPPAGPCDECGEGDPGWTDEAGFAGGQILLFTRDAVTDQESPILAFDLTDEAAAPLGANWAAPTWTHPDWTRVNLGTIFGVAIDDTGRSFVAHSSVYNAGMPRDTVGALGGPGAIYQIDSATGAPSLFATLPQTLDPSIMPASEAWPGIGNIAWDFDRGTLFATNHDDGRIYRMDGAGNIIDAWDHATDALSLGGAPEVGDADGFAPLGERLWAVCPTFDRLYYSVWGENWGETGVGTANEVWSVRLDAAGAIVTGTRQLEFATTPLQGEVSNPISDIAFDGECCMLISERTMNSASISGAHGSRAFRYCFDGNAWAIGTQYVVGYYSVGNNAAGGVDYDGGPEERAWISADALSFPSPYIYGATGIPVAGDAPSQSVLIDVDVNVSFGEKFQMGSLELTCYRDSTGPCLDVTGELDCLYDDAGILSDYALELEITNNSDNPAHYLLIAGPVSPGVVNLIPELAPGETRVIDLTVNGPIATETVCLNLTLYDSDFGDCCGIEDAELCLVVPECDCAIDQGWEIVCIDEAAGIYEFTFNLVNLTSDVVEHVFLIPDPSAPFSFDQDHIDVPATPPFSSTTIGPIEVTTSLGAGDTIEFIATLHVANLSQCCDQPLEFVLPNCGDGSSGHPADLDGDGVVGAADLGLVLANWGGSGLGDVDGDGVVGASDLGLVLAAFGLTV